MNTWKAFPLMVDNEISKFLLEIEIWVDVFLIKINIENERSHFL